MREGERGCSPGKERSESEVRGRRRQEGSETGLRRQEGSETGLRRQEEEGSAWSPDSGPKSVDN